MSENLIETGREAETPIAGRPEGLPEKFWDEAAGQPRIEAMAKSYRDLENRLGGAERLDLPESPDRYEIALDEGGLEPDPEVNQKLFEAGFSQSQAQLVYALAQERLMPMVQQMAAEFEAERQTERLVQHFGGSGKWAETARQISSWAKGNLPEEAVAALSTTYEGVVALHRMMQSGEPALGRGAGGAEAALNEDDLRQLMRDPRYWRQRDPAVVKRVEQGFRKLYGS